MLYIGGYGEQAPAITSIYCCVMFATSIPIPSLFGRRFKSKTAFMWLTLAMSVALLIFGIHCHYHGAYINVNADYNQHTPLILLGIIYFFFAIGPFRLTWHFVKKVIPAESYLCLRSLLVAFSWSAMFGITRILPRLIDTIGIGWIFCHMSIMALFAVIFVRIFVPEQLRPFSSSAEERKLVGSVSSSETNSERGDA